MKKILLFSFIVLFCLSFFLIYHEKNSSIDNQQYYCIKESNDYIYKETSFLCFNLFSNYSESIIAYPDKNDYFMSYNGNRYILSDVSITKIKQDEMTLYKIYARMPNIPFDIVTDNLILIIKNSKWSLKIDTGAFSLIHPEGELLSIQNLYGT